MQVYSDWLNLAIDMQPVYACVNKGGSAAGMCRLVVVTAAAMVITVVTSGTGA